MADKNTAILDLKNKYGMQPVCYEETWMHLNIKVLCLA